MANKLVNVTQLEYDLSRIAQAIRDKGITSSTMQFPDDFANTIQYSGSNFTSLGDFSEAEIIIAPGTPIFKSVDEDVLNNQIAQIADAIRYVTGYQGNFTFPRGIIGAISAMSEAVASYIPAGVYKNTNDDLLINSGSTIYSSNESGNSVYITINGNQYYVEKLAFHYTDMDYVELQVYNYYGECEQSFPMGNITLELSGSLTVNQDFYTIFMQYFNVVEQKSFTINGTSYTYNVGDTWGTWDFPYELGNGIYYTEFNGISYAYIMQGSGPYIYQYIKDAQGNYERYSEEIQPISYSLTTTAPDGSGPQITFYYEGSTYEVASGTTWGEFADSSVVPSLAVRYVNDIAYIYDAAYDSYVGTYEDNAPVKASDTIIENQNYYHGWEPSTGGGGGSDLITFYINGEPCTCTPGLVWADWIDENSNITLNGTYYNFNYNTYGSYVAWSSEYSSGILAYNNEAIYYSANIQEGAYYQTTSSFLYGSYNLTNKNNAASAFTVSLSPSSPFATITATRIYNNNGDATSATFTDDIYYISGNTGSTSITLEQGYGYTGSYTVPNVCFSSINQSGYNITSYYPCANGGAYSGVGPAISINFYIPTVVTSAAYTWFNS